MGGGDGEVEKDVIPNVCVAPAVGAGADRLPGGATPRGWMTAGSVRAEDPQDAIDDAPMVLGRMASMRLLRRNDQWMELEIEAEGELELGGEGLSAAGRLDAWIPAGDGDSSNLERMEATRRRRGRASLLHPVPPAAGDLRSAGYGKAAVCQPSR